MSTHMHLTRVTLRGKQNQYLAKTVGLPMLSMNVGAPHKTCQWIEGEPEDRNFCNAPVAEHSSYCPEHHAVVWRDPDPAKSILVRRVGA